MSRGHSLSPLTGHAPLASAPNAPFCAHHRKRRRAFSSKPECPFLRNHDKLGPLPLPNGDSIEPLDSSSELAACGDPRVLFSLAFRNPKIERQAGPDPSPLDAMRDALTPEQIERQRREYEEDMKRMLWAVGPIVIFFFLVWLVHQ